MEILLSFLYQMLFSVGLIVCFGFLISFCRRTFVNMTGQAGCRILLVSGAVGTPVHELSHAAMCLLFGHRIEEINLYQPRSDDGTLGYVNHSFNPKNLYHQIGNFFIGIAPILCGSGVLFLLMLLMAPNAYDRVCLSFEAIPNMSTSLASWDTYRGFFGLMWSVVTSVFHYTNMDSAWWWIFIVLAIMISSHMELSTADIRGGLIGLGFLAGLILVVDLIVGLISQAALDAVTNAVTSFSLYIVGFLSISVIFCGLMVLVAVTVKGIRAIFH